MLLYVPCNRSISHTQVSIPYQQVNKCYIKSQKSPIKGDFLFQSLISRSINVTKYSEPFVMKRYLFQSLISRSINVTTYKSFLPSLSAIVVSIPYQQVNKCYIIIYPIFRYISFSFNPLSAGQ